MRRTTVALIACLAPAAAAGAPAYAGTGWAAHAERFPYTLVDPGTLGGPSSYVALPGVPITRDGTVLGAADTTTPDSDVPSDDYHDGYVQHAFTWRDGRLTDLGALPRAADDNSAIFGLNAHRIGVGVSDDGQVDPLTRLPAQHATLFAHGQVTDLGTLGGNESGAWFINAHGQVTGMSTNAVVDPSSQQSPFFPFFPFVAETRTFVWRDGVMRDIGTLGGSDALPNAQNERGQIAGISFTHFTANPATGIPTADPFLWDDGHMRDLGTLGGTEGSANWVNDRGEVAGTSDLAGDDTAHPFLWRNGRIRDLGTLGGDYGLAAFVNDRGDVTGGSQVADGTFHTFLWHHDTLVDLPPVGAGVNAFGEALNDHDQVVGHNDDPGFMDVSAAIWSGGRGYDLNTLVAPSSFQMTSANYITEQGEIFGHGIYTSGPNKGDQRVFVLIRNPAVPLPSGSPSAALLRTTEARARVAGALYRADRDRVAARMPALLHGPTAMRDRSFPNAPSAAHAVR
jgi:probable HAF family extracellular repeat protein